MITEALAEHGLFLRGGFNFEPGDDAPPGIVEKRAGAVLLIGQAGASFWPHFAQWRGKQSPSIANPLDSWSREVIDAVAERFGARGVSPSDRPFLPFQQWAMRAEGLRPSPLGILMHPEYGLWHAYRGALLFDGPLAFAASAKVRHLCDECAGKPCLKACPVGAHSGGSFAYEECIAHAGAEIGIACRSAGCLDRNACPIGEAYRYPVEVQRFHMRSFLGG